MRPSTLGILLGLGTGLLASWLGLVLLVPVYHFPSGGDDCLYYRRGSQAGLFRNTLPVESMHGVMHGGQLFTVESRGDWQQLFPWPVVDEFRESFLYIESSPAYGERTVGIQRVFRPWTLVSVWLAWERSQPKGTM